MKYLNLLLIFLASMYSFGQVTGADIYYFDQVRSALLIDSYNANKGGNLKGVYLFDTWYNRGRVYQDNKSYRLDQLNYNIQQDRFEAKFEQDSVFVLSSPRDVVVEIGKRKFKRFIEPESGRLTFFEVLVNFKGKSLLIGYNLKMEKAPVNPMTKLSSGPDKLVKQENYYLTGGEDNDLQKIKLNKKTVLGFIEKEKQPEMQKFVKTYELKYKKVSDVVTILGHYNSI